MSGQTEYAAIVQVDQITQPVGSQSRIIGSEVTDWYYKVTYGDGGSSTEGNSSGDGDCIEIITDNRHLAKFLELGGTFTIRIERND